MSTRTGTLLFYDVPTNFYVSPKTLAEKGFADFMPRNSFKSAFISALRKVYKDKDKFYRAFDDSSENDTVFFGCFVEAKTDQDIQIKKEVVFEFNKKFGTYKITNSELTDSQKELVSKIDEAFRKEVQNFNSSQFRTVIKNVLRSCFAVSIKKGSSVFFLDKKYDMFRDKIHELSSAFPEIKIHSWEHGNDSGAVEAVKEAVKEDVLSDLEESLRDLKKEVNDGTITNKKVQNKREKINGIIDKVKAHAHNLQTDAVEILSRLQKIDTEVSKYEDKADSLTFDIMDELAKI